MQRAFWVEFGPSRSKRFAKAVETARKGADEFIELEAGRYRARFDLGKHPGAYVALAGLLERVRHWRATQVYEQDEPVSLFHAKEMAWCASCQLKSYGACRFRFIYGVFPRCATCPLFDAGRAINDALGENPPPTAVFEIELGPNIRALLRGEVPPDLDQAPGPEVEVPDFVPEEWAEPPGEEPPP
jgi:hypothetical protein